MDKLKMHSLDGVAKNIEAIAALFPNAVTEVVRDGKVQRAIDFDVLRQELSDHVVEGREERYQFTWPDKRKAMLAANAPIAATLRPVREQSVGRDGTPGGFDSENLYIEGDNLEVLKLLQETYLGKVKMIYIDPPYNTGNDFVYEDDFTEDKDSYMERSGQYDEQGNQLVQNTESNGRFHTDWLNMIYPRLKLAKLLLASDGVIAISIGYHEMCNLLKICQEVFSGYQIFPITVKTSGGKPNGAFNISNEYVIFIAPESFIPVPTEEDMKEYASPYHGMNLATFTQVERPNQAYPIYIDKKNGSIIGCGKSLQQRIKEGIYSGFAGDFIYDKDEGPEDVAVVWPVTTKGEQCVWRLIPERLMSDWKAGYIKVVPIKNANSKNEYTIQYLSNGIIEKIKSGEIQTYRISDNPLIPTLEVKEYKTAGAGIASIWDDTNFYTTKGNNEIRELFGNKIFSYPKPLGLVSYIIKRATANDSLIMDFFSGSATTAHAVMQVNAQDKGKRKFIMIQLPEKCDDNSEAKRAGKDTLCDIGKERIRRAGRKIKDEAGMTAHELDIGFRCLRLDSSNMQDVYYIPDTMTQSMLDMTTDNIKPDRSPEDLLFQTMLDLGVPLSSAIVETEIAGKRVFDVEDGYMIACFDEGVTDETVTAIAKRTPNYAVFRDSCMASDSVATNFEQIFETYSPKTQRKVL